MNWADDVDEEVTPAAPKIEERDEGNGIKVITEYRTNPDGKKIKVGAGRSGGDVCCPQLTGFSPHLRSPGESDAPSSRQKSMLPRQSASNGPNLEWKKAVRQARTPVQRRWARASC